MSPLQSHHCRLCCTLVLLLTDIDEYNAITEEAEMLTTYGSNNRFFSGYVTIAQDVGSSYSADLECHISAIPA